MVQETRRSARYPFFAAAEITETQTKSLMTARTSELGRYGCYMDVMNAFPHGTPLRIRITYNGQFIDAPARVVHSQPNIGTGISFDGIEPAEERILETWLSALESA